MMINRIPTSSRKKSVSSAIVWSFTFFFFGTVMGGADAALSPHTVLKPSPQWKNRILTVRGGYSDYVPSSSDHNTEMEDPYSFDTPTDRETVQERVDRWRHQQQDQTNNANAFSSARDEQGRMKLLTSVGKGSRALVFFLFLWRNVHLYEVADRIMKGPKRVLFVTPIIALFLGNMAGAVASITSPSHSAKKRLKAILNLDKLLEIVLIAWYLLRLTVIPTKYTPREIYISSILHSVFFILQCQAFTKLSWDEAAAPNMNAYMEQQQTQWQERAEESWRETPPSQYNEYGEAPYQQNNY